MVIGLFGRPIADGLSVSEYGGLTAGLATICIFAFQQGMHKALPLPGNLVLSALIGAFGLTGIASGVALTMGADNHGLAVDMLVLGYLAVGIPVAGKVLWPLFHRALQSLHQYLRQRETTLERLRIQRIVERIPTSWRSWPRAPGERRR